MKRLLVGVLLSMLLPAGGDAVLAAGKNLKIAMVLWRGETEAEKGFQQGLKDLGYSVQYTVMNAGEDRAELGRLLREDDIGVVRRDALDPGRSELRTDQLRVRGEEGVRGQVDHIEHGALMGVVPDYLQLGKAAATMIHRHQGGQKLEDMPVQADRDPDLKINGATARLLGITIPEPVRKRAIVVE
jgi:ABC-type uncharacterized transport system substrate-binding protein